MIIRLLPFAFLCLCMLAFCAGCADCAFYMHGTNNRPWICTL